MFVLFIVFSFYFFISLQPTHEATFAGASCNHRWVLLARFEVILLLFGLDTCSAISARSCVFSFVFFHILFSIRMCSK